MFLCTINMCYMHLRMCYMRMYCDDVIYVLMCWDTGLYMNCWSYISVLQYFTNALSRHISGQNRITVIMRHNFIHNTFPGAMKVRNDMNNIWSRLFTIRLYYTPAKPTAHSLAVIFVVEATHAFTRTCSRSVLSWGYRRHVLCTSLANGIDCSYLH
jgi:hypothetical protein